MSVDTDAWLPQVTREYPEYKLHPEQVEVALELLELRPVRERAAQVYRLLVERASKWTRVYPKQQTLADRLGVTRKTISRAVKELKDAGLLLVIRGARRCPAYWVVPGAVFPSKVDPGKRWLEPMSHLSSNRPAAPTAWDSSGASLLQNPGADGAGRKTPTTNKPNRIKRFVRQAKEKVMEFTPRPLPPRSRKTPRRYDDEPQSPQDLVSEEFFGERYKSPAQKQSESKPVEKWRANDLVRHWLSVLREQEWCRNKVDHTNQRALGRVFREYLDAERSAETLKTCIDTYLTAEAVHRDADVPWKHFRALLPSLLRKAQAPGQVGAETLDALAERYPNLLD